MLVSFNLHNVKKYKRVKKNLMQIVITVSGEALTLMLELSMFSKSSGGMVGTLFTRSVRNRPTLLSAATFPDWNRSNRFSPEITHFTLSYVPTQDVFLFYFFCDSLNTHQHIVNVCQHRSQHVLYPGCSSTHLGQVRGQTLGATRSIPCPLKKVH